MYYINKCNMKRFMKFYNTCTYTWLNIDPFSIPRRSRGRGGLHVSYNLGVCVWEIKVSAWSIQVRYMVLSSPNLIGCMVHLGMVMDFTDLDEYCLWSTSKFVKQVIYWSITTAPVWLTLPYNIYIYTECWIKFRYGPWFRLYGRTNAGYGRFLDCSKQIRPLGADYILR